VPIGHGRVADDPVADVVDVAAGGEVHHGVGAVADGPDQLVDFFRHGGGDGAVADIGVDLHEEVAADDHRLEFGVIDVGRDDGAAAGDFLADEFGRDEIGDRGAEIFAVANEGLPVASRRMFSRMATYSISGVMMPRRAYSSCVTVAPALARSTRGCFGKGGVSFSGADVAVVFRLHFAAVDLFDIAARFHPCSARAGEAGVDVDGDVRDRCRGRWDRRW
jgi:hypothetical protein